MEDLLLAFGVLGAVGFVCSIVALCKISMTRIDVEVGEKGRYRLYDRVEGLITYLGLKECEGTVFKKRK